MGYDFSGRYMRRPQAIGGRPLRRCETRSAAVSRKILPTRTRYGLSFSGSANTLSSAASFSFSGSIVPPFATRRMVWAASFAALSSAPCAANSSRAFFGSPLGSASACASDSLNWLTDRAPVRQARIGSVVPDLVAATWRSSSSKLATRRFVISDTRYKPNSRLSV